MRSPFLLSILPIASLVVGQGSQGGSQASCSAAQSWVYQACYASDANGPHVAFTWQLSSNPTSPNYYPGFNNAVTPQICQTGCRGHGFVYAALWNSSSCYCGVKIPTALPGSTAQGGPGGYTGYRPGSIVAASNCNVTGFPCSGDPNQYCGSSTAAAVYLDPSIDRTTSYKTSDYYNYAGCFTDVSPGPLYAKIQTDNSVSCSNYCGQLGYPMSGRSGYDSQTSLATCGCGTEVQTGNQVNDTLCNFKCSGTTGAS